MLFFQVLLDGLGTGITADSELVAQIVENAERMKAWLGERYVAVQWRIEKCLMKDDCDEGVLRKCSEGEHVTPPSHICILSTTLLVGSIDWLLWTCRFLMTGRNTDEELRD